MINLYKQIASDIFKELGSGFEECIYQKAFEVSLRQRGIKYENQKVIPVVFQGFHIGESKLDLVVHDNDELLIIELKAIGSLLSAKEETQLRKYMECSGVNKGLLVNFPQAGRKGNSDEVEFIEL